MSDNQSSITLPHLNMNTLRKIIKGVIYLTAFLQTLFPKILIYTFQTKCFRFRQPFVITIGIDFIIIMGNLSIGKHVFR